MPITTTDVVTAAHANIETIKNSTCVVTCTNVGTFKTIDPTYETSLTYNQLQSLLTNRFDDIAYYNAVDGGTP
jgi:hypothetical protein